MDNMQRAYAAVNKAKRSGHIMQQKCAECESDRHVEAHHDDYSKPLEVRPLCRKCHRRWHAEHGAGKDRGLRSKNTVPILFDPELLAQVEEAWHDARCRNRNEWIMNAIREQLERDARAAKKKQGASMSQ